MCTHAPGKHIRMVSIASDNLSGIVFEGIDQGSICEELIVLLGTAKLSDVEVHTTLRTDSAMCSERGR